VECVLLCSRLNLLASRANGGTFAALPLKGVAPVRGRRRHFERTGRCVTQRSGLSLAAEQLRRRARLSWSSWARGGKRAVSGIEFESRDQEPPWIGPEGPRARENPAAAAMDVYSVLRSFRGIEVEVRQRESSVPGAWWT